MLHPADHAGTQITVAGHMGSIGNDAADKLAKEAVELVSSNATPTATYYDEETIRPH